MSHVNLKKYFFEAILLELDIYKFIVLTFSLVEWPFHNYEIFFLISSISSILVFKSIVYRGYSPLGNANWESGVFTGPFFLGGTWILMFACQHHEMDRNSLCFIGIFCLACLASALLSLWLCSKITSWCFPSLLGSWPLSPGHLGTPKLQFLCTKPHETTGSLLLAEILC